MIDNNVDAFDAVANEFASQIRRGENPNFEKYANDHPNIADSIRQLFPILEMMERFGNSKESWSEKDLLEQANDSLVDHINQPPERLGDFRIVREIGRGGMGVVFEAEQESLGRRVALKVLPSSAQFDHRRQFRFNRESRASAKLHHTNIVPVFGMGTQDGLSYFVMQFIDGKPLSELILDLQNMRNADFDSSDLDLQNEIAASLYRELQGSGSRTEDHSASREAKSLDDFFDSTDSTQATLGDSKRQNNFINSVARIGARAAEALHYAHECGVLHRDVKPSNLLLDRSGSIWVTDFGLAKYLDSPDFTKTGEMVGTLRYMSPEQLDGDATPQTDVFGLGLTLFELLALRPAYADIDRKKLLSRVCDAEPPMLRTIDSSIPKDLETIVAKCTMREPTQRYDNANEVAEDLNRFLAGQPIEARRISLPEKTWKWCRRHPTLSILITALAMSIAIGITGISWQWQKTAQALEIAKENLEQANQAAVRAEKHFGQAQSAVDKYVSSISNDLILKTPNLQFVQSKLLAEALNFQKEFVDSYKNNPDMKLLLAKGFYKIADISLTMGKHEESLENVDAALRQLSEFEELGIGNSEDHAQKLSIKADSLALKGAILSSTNNDADQYFDQAISTILEIEKSKPLEFADRFSLVRYYRRRALFEMSRSRDQNEFILSTFHKAHEILEQLMEEDDKAPGLTILYAELLRDLAITNRRMGNLDKTADYYELAIQILEPRVDAQPKHAEFRSLYAAILNSYGYYFGYTKHRDPDKAIECFQKSIDHYEIVSQQNPLALEFQEGMSRAALNCGSIYQSEHQYEQAFEKRRLAESIRRKLVSQYPKIVAYRSDWGNALMGLGATCAESGDNPMALKFLNQALEQHEQVDREAPGKRDYRARLASTHGQLAQVYADLGEHEKTIRHFELLAPADETDPELYYKAIRALVQYAIDIDDDEAVKEFQNRALDMAKSNSDFLINKGLDVANRLESDFYFRKDKKTKIGSGFITWLKNQFAAKE